MDASDTQRADELFSGQCGPDFEVDGGSHRGREAADARRDRKLARLGYRVVRVEAEAVLGNSAGAIAVIRQALAD